MTLFMLICWRRLKTIKGEVSYFLVISLVFKIHLQETSHIVLPAVDTSTSLALESPNLSHYLSSYLKFIKCLCTEHSIITYDDFLLCLIKLLLCLLQI